MKRAFFLAAAVLIVTAMPFTARACQYCRMALEDPETARMITDNRGGSFPLDGAIGQYQPAPVAADLKTAPAADSVVTSASALTAPVLPGANGSVPAPIVHRPVLPPPAPVATTSTPQVKPVPAVGNTVNATVAHWTDACLLGLVAAGGIFCWRTRRSGPTNL